MESETDECAGEPLGERGGSLDYAQHSFVRRRRSFLEIRLVRDPKEKEIAAIFTLNIFSPLFFVGPARKGGEEGETRAMAHGSIERNPLAGLYTNLYWDVPANLRTAACDLIGRLGFDNKAKLLLDRSLVRLFFFFLGLLCGPFFAFFLCACVMLIYLLDFFFL